MHDTAREPGHLDPGYTEQDWDAVCDTPELTDDALARLRPARDFPVLADLLPKRGRGRPRLADAKVNLTLRVDPGLLAAYKATGPGWQVRMHEALAAALVPEQGVELPAASSTTPTIEKPDSA